MEMKVVESGSDCFLEGIFRVLDGGLSKREADAAKVAVAAESRKWVGSYDWDGVAGNVVVAALTAVAEDRCAVRRRARYYEIWYLTVGLAAIGGLVWFCGTWGVW